MIITKQHMVRYIDSIDSWNTIINKHEHDGTILVVTFSADYCSPCKALAKKLDTMDTLYGEGVLFFKIDIEEMPEVANQYKIASIPTTIVTHACEIKHRVMGAHVNPLVKAIDDVLQHN